jgi:hypothetical protein
MRVVISKEQNRASPRTRAHAAKYPQHRGEIKYKTANANQDNICNVARRTKTKVQLKQEHEKRDSAIDNMP